VTRVDDGLLQAGGRNVAVNPVLSSDGGNAAYPSSVALDLPLAANALTAGSADDLLG